MKKLSLLLLLVIFCFGLRANDGAFYSKGNHLIPITESDIRVQKEILTITRVDDTVGWGSMFLVNVYYEFFNPGEAKDLIVGFEAPSPDGHVTPGDNEYMYKGDPYINGFQVIMNGKNLSYQIAHVPYKAKGAYDYDYTRRTEDYYKDGQVQDMSFEQYMEFVNANFDNPDECWEFYGVLYYYVYHFNAHFEPGVNIIQHTYTSKGSALVMMDYMFDYILTAANRWANNGIDDFTLVLDLGDMTGVYYVIEGVDAEEWKNESGKVILRKKNFHPEGELSIGKRDEYYEEYDDDE